MSELKDLATAAGPAQVEAVLSRFTEAHAEATAFPQLGPADRRAAWAALLALVGAAPSPTVELKALKSCRLLSRDKTGLNECVDNSHVDTLVERSQASEATPHVRYSA